MNDPIQRLIQELAKLPSIGQKTATRLAFHILRMPGEQIQDLSQALLDIKSKIRMCSVCMHVTEQDPCIFCQDERRDSGMVCVVGHSTDLLAIERTGSYLGKYHVLHGLLSPLEGVGPEQLRIRELFQRLQTREEMLPEVILATSPNVEGEATATYLARLLKPLGGKITRIASGLPIGGELEYADGITIRRALEVRREL